jgi:hypothetical protein
MIEQLFGSKTRVKLLRLFYSNPNRSFYVREITRKVDEQINSVRRELSNLLAIGIIKSDNTNNKLYYEVNQSYEFYEPFRVVFGGAQLVASVEPAPIEPAVPVEATDATVPASKPVAKPKKVTATINPELQQLGNVELAVYTGTFTRDESAGIDFLVVGDINKTQLNRFVSELEDKEGRPIRYTVMSADSFRYREQIHDRFVSAIKASKKQVLVDKAGLLG